MRIFGLILGGTAVAFYGYYRWFQNVDSLLTILLSSIIK
jgi:hypothetical protein